MKPGREARTPTLEPVALVTMPEDAVPGIMGNLKGAFSGQGSDKSYCSKKTPNISVWLHIFEATVAQKPIPQSPPCGTS